MEFTEKALLTIVGMCLIFGLILSMLIIKPSSEMIGAVSAAIVILSGMTGYVAVRYINEENAKALAKLQNQTSTSTS